MEYTPDHHQHNDRNRHRNPNRQERERHRQPRSMVRGPSMDLSYMFQQPAQMKGDEKQSARAIPGVEDKTERYITNSFTYNENSTKGTDKVQETSKEVKGIKNKDGNVTGSVTNVTTATATVDAEGQVSEVSFNRTSESLNYATGEFKKTALDTKDEKVSKELSTKINKISEYKKQNGISPLQQKAKDNETASHVNNSISGATGVLSLATSRVKNPYVQGFSFVSGAISSATFLRSGAFQTNPEKIEQTDYIIIPQIATPTSTKGVTGSARGF